MRSPWDRRLAVLFVLTAIAEVLLRRELAARPVSAALGVAFAGAIWFRRTHPLGATVVVFGGAAVVALVDTWRGLPTVSAYASASVLLLPYSLFRWGSRRDIALGLLSMAAAL